MDIVKYFFTVLLLGVTIEIFPNLELINTLLLWVDMLWASRVYSVQHRHLVQRAMDGKNSKKTLLVLMIPVLDTAICV